MDTKGGKPQGGGSGGVLNWVTGIDMYTLMCIKLMTNKNLLYKKINKIKFKKKKLQDLSSFKGKINDSLLDGKSGREFPGIINLLQLYMQYFGQE